MFKGHGQAATAINSIVPEPRKRFQQNLQHRYDELIIGFQGHGFKGQGHKTFPAEA